MPPTSSRGGDSMVRTSSKVRAEKINKVSKGSSLRKNEDRRNPVSVSEVRSRPRLPRNTDPDYSPGKESRGRRRVTKQGGKNCPGRKYQLRQDREVRKAYTPPEERSSKKRIYSGDGHDRRRPRAEILRERSRERFCSESDSTSRKTGKLIDDGGFQRKPIPESLKARERVREGPHSRERVAEEGYYPSSKGDDCWLAKGDLVLAQMPGWPVWPAMVDSCPRTGHFYHQEERGLQYYLTFFDAQEEDLWSAWVAASCLQGLHTIARLRLPKEEKQWEEKLQGALARAWKASEMPTHQRLATFSQFNRDGRQPGHEQYNYSTDNEEDDREMNNLLKTLSSKICREKEKYLKICKQIDRVGKEIGTLLA